MLLDRGAKLEASNPRVYDGATSLVIALEFDQHDAAKLLLDRGASVAGATGTAALELAARSGFDDLVEIHIYRRLSAPHDTVFRAHEDAPLVKLLVGAGAKLEAVDHEGNTALHQAAMMDAAAAATVLLAAGASPRKKNGEGKTPHELAKDRDNSVEPILRKRP